MSDTSQEATKKELDKKDDYKYPSKEFKDALGKKAQLLLVQSQIYKQPRMNTLAAYERLYNNDILPKLRQMFNVPLPVFSGMIDELLAMFNDQVQIKFKATNPAQHLVVPKIQAHWTAERDSLAPTAMWNYKTRVDRFNAVLSGRGILQEYAYNDPEYCNVLKTIYYSDFHNEPNGGGILENHLFCGTESNFKTLFDLKSSSKYDQTQVDALEKTGWTDEMFKNLETTYGTKFARWRALGLNIETNAITGTITYNLCDFVITHNGIRYNVVFEPCSGLWLSVEPWKDIYPSGLYPFKSWATHEDDVNFWSKSFADDLYPIADAIITMFNQELTNREKKNFNARAYDQDMFEDLAKLDAAQYRPDALVPANTMGGTKQISNGIYSFETAELKGTVDLISWVSDYTGQKTGADELPPAQGSKKVAVQMLQQQKLSKRIGLHSDSFKECYSQLGTTFVEGMKEFMPPKLSVQVIGENGFIEEQELKRIEVKKCGIIGISVTSTSEQEGADQLKKDGRMKAIEMVTQNPDLSKYEKETIYRDIGQFDEQEITFLLDKEGSISRKQVAHSSQAIQQILLGKKPNIYYGADLSYLNYFKQYIIDHKEEIKKKINEFSAFLEVMSPIVQKNMQDIAANTPPKPQVGPDGKPVQPQTPTATPAPVAPKKLSLPASANRMGKVAA